MIFAFTIFGSIGIALPVGMIGLLFINQSSKFKGNALIHRSQLHR